MNTGLRLNQLIAKIGLKKPTIYAYIKKGILPPPIKFGRASVWIEQEVDLAISKRIMERDSRKISKP
jgi:prophage regulatory protein